MKDRAAPLHIRNRSATVVTLRPRFRIELRGKMHLPERMSGSQTVIRCGLNSRILPPVWLQDVRSLAAPHG